MKKSAWISGFVFLSASAWVVGHESVHEETSTESGHEEMHQPMESTQESMHGGQEMGRMMHKGGHTHSMETLSGKPGVVAEVSQTVQVTAGDDMRFHADKALHFREGETVRFVVTNKGAVDHEFVIGTQDEHREHGAMMMNNPGMHHGDMPNAISLHPGETKEVVWQFDNAWQIEVACNVPGHYQAGMHSEVSIAK